jgi:hypothetical protein
MPERRHRPDLVAAFPFARGGSKVADSCIKPPLVGLRLTITRELATLRMWRTLGDVEGENRCSAHIDEMLDRLMRYQDRSQPLESAQ